MQLAKMKALKISQNATEHCGIPLRWEDCLETDFNEQVWKDKVVLIEKR